MEVNLSFHMAKDLLKNNVEAGVYTRAFLEEKLVVILKIY